MRLLAWPVRHQRVDLDRAEDALGDLDACMRTEQFEARLCRAVRLAPAV